MKPALGSVTVGMIVLQLAVSMAHAAEEMPAEIIAAQIRDQGYACDKAIRAKRDGERLDDAVWILKCQNATHRVRPHPRHGGEGRAASLDGVDVRFWPIPDMDAARRARPLSG